MLTPKGWAFCVSINDSISFSTRKIAVLAGIERASVTKAQANVHNDKKNFSMEFRKFSRRPSGSGKNEPKVMSELLEDFFRSNEPLARAYRDHLFPHTELNVDLKLLTQKPGRMPEGECLIGTIAHDSENHFTFCEALSETKSRKHNPCIYKGYAINVHRKDDGTIYPTFRQPQYTRYYTFRDFCREAAEELLLIAGFVEEEMSE